MKKQIMTVVAGLCGLTLACLSAPAAHAQDAAKVLVTARAAQGPFVRVWMDNDKGISTDSKAAKNLQPQFGGTDWTVLEDGRATVSKDGKVLLPPMKAQWSNDETFFVLHGYSKQNGVVTVADGRMFRDLEDPKQSWGYLNIIQVQADGAARAIYVESYLTFAETGGGSDDGGSNDGFGGF